MPKSAWLSYDKQLKSQDKMRINRNSVNWSLLQNYNFIRPRETQKPPRLLVDHVPFQRTVAQHRRLLVERRTTSLEALQLGLELSDALFILLPGRQPQ